MIQSLGLSSPYLQEPTEEDLRKRLTRAAKARNILAYDDFIWWVDNVIDPRNQVQLAALVWKDEEPNKYHERRGIIKGISKVLQELRKNASEVEDLEKELSENVERTRPVARRE